jgi:SSS family transporter
MLIGFILAYLSINLFVGWWASRKIVNTEDFVLAGRGLSLGLSAMVTFATWFGSETMMGAPSEFIEHGIAGVIEEPFGAALCLILVGLFYARTFYRLNILTFCDYFKIRFGPTAELVSAVVMIPSYFGWIAAQLIAMGTVLEVIMGWHLQTGIWLSALLVMSYTLMGGMWSISVTDFFHNIVLIIGLVILFFVLEEKIGGITPVLNQSPKGFFSFAPTSFSGLGIAQYITAWITVGLGSIPQQDIFQRVMSSKNENTAVRASVLAGFLYISVALLPLMIALMAKYLHPELMQSDNRMLIPNLVMKHTNIFLQILFFGALISAVLSTTSGAILAPASVLGENIIKPFFPALPDKQLLLIIRFSVVLVTFASIWMASSRQDIFELVGESSAFSLVSLFVPLTVGLYWKKANATGCVASMLLGLGSWAICHFIYETAFPAPLIGLLVSLVSMIVGSLIKRT